uniref:E-selectin n=1 Tax=Latimeria chalumnae TaxID=7897 RepID=M3XIE7_LATCH|nr:PREDICTED: P-selectin-like isoform X2 [Latimeria chalumnae]|eukprot:XP_005994120.1 PREDICTED: P-selectin-like isoform X2 [Latimeria chalumnae]
MASLRRSSLHRRQTRKHWSTVQFFCIAVFIYETLIAETGAWTYHYNKEKNLNWIDARHWCRKEYTDMVAIQNQKEIQHLNQELPLNPSYYWIGIRKINEIWTWVGTNRSLTEEAKNWAPNEPNNLGKSQDCVEIYIKRDKDAGKWNDEPCSKLKGTICYLASCNSTSCSGNGECIEMIGNHTCCCYEGFLGPKCKDVVQCKKLENPEHGNMTCSQPLGQFRYQSSCTFGCAEGFFLAGEPRLQCTASGNWTSPSPTCEAVKCSILRSSDQGTMNCSHLHGDFTYSSTCHFGCVPGFHLIGSEYLTCAATGDWTTPTPSCQVVQCGKLTTPARGKVNCSNPFGEFSYDSICDFACEEGFLLAGSRRLQCEASGNWSTLPPVCEAVKCSTLKIPDQGTMNCSHPHEDFTYNSVCHFGCAAGFYLSGSEQLTCMVSGNWTTPTPLCQAVNCMPLKIPDQGTMNCSHPHGNFTYSSTCHFGCVPGFHLSGSKQIRCAASGNWTAPTPSCQALKCKALTPPRRSLVDCTRPFGVFSYNSSCHFTCEKGFLINGSDNLQCTASGQWTAPAPTCEGISCGKLEVPEWAVMLCTHPVKSYSYNSTCLFSCEKGFLLKGQGMLQCDAMGGWTAQTPVCEAVKCNSLKIAEPMMMNCTHPYGNFSFNSTCKFDCMEGFVLNRSQSLQCGASAHWTDRIPTCEVSSWNLGKKMLVYMGGAAGGVAFLALSSALIVLLTKPLQKPKGDKEPLTPKNSVGNAGSETFSNPTYEELVAGAE